MVKGDRASDFQLELLATASKLPPIHLAAGQPEADAAMLGEVRRGPCGLQCNRRSPAAVVCDVLHERLRGGSLGDLPHAPDSSCQSARSTGGGSVGDQRDGLPPINVSADARLGLLGIADHVPDDDQLRDLAADQVEVVGKNDRIRQTRLVEIAIVLEPDDVGAIVLIGTD
jgi:hypothetical protein